MNRNPHLKTTFHHLDHLQTTFNQLQTLQDSNSSNETQDIDNTFQNIDNLIQLLKNQTIDLTNSFNQEYNLWKSKRQTHRVQSILDEIIQLVVDREVPVINEQLESECESVIQVEKQLQAQSNVTDQQTPLNNLSENSSQVDPLPSPQEPLKETSLELVQDKTNECVEEVNGDSESTKLDELDEPKPKSFLKCISIDKLVEPKLLHKVKELDDTILISDSDEDSTKTSSRITRKRNGKIKTRSPVKENSINLTPKGKNITRKSILINSEGKNKSTSGEGKDSDRSTDSPSTLQKKKVRFECTSSSSSSEEENQETKEKEINLDKKFNLKAFVRLPQIPCEKLKEYYMKKMEIEEVDDRKRKCDEEEDSSVKQPPTKRSRILDETDDNSPQSSLENAADKEETNDKTMEVIDSDSDKKSDCEDEKSETSDVTELPEQNNDETDGTVVKKVNLKIVSSDSEDALETLRKKREEKKKTKTKLTKKKAKIIDSDSDSSTDNVRETKSDSSSEDEQESEEQKSDDQKKKRRRIKRVDDSDSSDKEKGKTTRKQIRKVIHNDSLTEATKRAEREEFERKSRIQERQQKVYNNIFDKDKPKESDKVETLVLDFDETTKQELLTVPQEIVQYLKPHQAKGVQFMWDSCFESIQRTKTTNGSGCILAHCMGLGKTLQVIALVYTLLINEKNTNVSTVLVVCPLNTVLNWVAEFNKWLADVKGPQIDVYELVSYKQNYERNYYVNEWHKGGGVLVIGYDMYRNLSNPLNKRMSKKFRSSFQKALVDPGPDLVVCDEGHLLKNEKTNLSIAMNRLKSLRRIVLTGTPMQNNLKEYYCMVQFVKPSLLGTYKEYLNRFVNPITNGQYTDSTPHDIDLMRRRSHVLHKMLDGIVQRKDYAVLKPFLPPKYEYVLFLSLSEVQLQLYRHYLDNFARNPGDNKMGKTHFLFMDFQEFQRICTHPRVLLDKSIELRAAREKLDDDDEEDSEGSLKDFIDDDEDEELSAKSTSDYEESDNEKPITKKKTRLTRATAAAEGINVEEETKKVEQTAKEDEWWREFCTGSELDNIAHSTKLYLLFEILQQCEAIGDKLLVFSQSLYSLNVIEYFLHQIDEATQNDRSDKVCGFSGSWALGLDYFRLDGSSSCDNRSLWCDSFNNPDNPRARLFLISTRAGGLGINLVAANRVIIFDVSWNPSHDLQSIYRVYRFGQTKPCYIYRFVTFGTMEMKIYERQVTKQAISKRVIDEQQIDRHYNQNDLAELYKFSERPIDQPTPLVPKDVLLGELLQSQRNRIVKYHEHQSLLENIEDEELNEEERKAAWEEFENEKTNRINPGLFGLDGFPGTIMNIPIPTITMALSSILRKDNPLWTNAQVQTMVPELLKILQQEIQQGIPTTFTRVTTEIRYMQAKQQQVYQELVMRQQAMRMMQHRLQTAQNNLAGTSTDSNKRDMNNVLDIIELND